MKRLTRVLAILAISLPAAVAPAAPSAADHSDGIYELPAIAQWAKTSLNVLVVPPNHGQIWNEDKGFLNGMKAEELTPFNSYLTAIEEAIREWKRGVDTFGSESLQKTYDVRVYVLGRDTVPPEVMTRPDIAVVTEEAGLIWLGVAVRVIPCIVDMTKIFIESFSYADMYNVTGQEFGHCLGLQHVGSQGGIDPTSALKHPEHDVMNGFYTHWVGEKGTHLHCVSNLDVLALEYVWSTRNPSIFPSGGPSKTTYMPVGAYGTTCEPPPSDWRVMTAGTPSSPPQPAPAPPPSPTPTPTPSHSPSPEPTPSAQPSSSPEPAPTEPPEHHTPETTIDDPRHGTSLIRSAFTGVSGSTAGTVDEATKIQVALARRTKRGCDWWVAKRHAFVERSCSSPRWNRASGTTEWTFALAQRMPVGRYRALSRARSVDHIETCCHSGRNLVEFRLM